jgi:hypothetical protein
MERQAEVRLFRGPLSSEWFAAVVASDGKRVIQKWRFVDQDQAALNAAFPASPNEGNDS